MFNYSPAILISPTGEVSNETSAVRTGLTFRSTLRHLSTPNARHLFCKCDVVEPTPLRFNVAFQHVKLQITVHSSVRRTTPMIWVRNNTILTFDHNFGKCTPIFKILYLTDSQYSIRLEAVSYLCWSCLLLAFDDAYVPTTDRVMSAFSAVLLIYSFQFRPNMLLFHVRQPGDTAAYVV